MSSFYAKIGEERLHLVISTFYGHVFSSPIIGSLFTIDREEIMSKQIKFLTQFLGGPDLYSREFGHPQMRKRHLPFPIDEKAKTEWLRCMRLSIDTVFSDDSELGNNFYAVFPRIADHMVNQ